MSSYHLLGIGGIGMSALARILKQKKIKVTGQDAKSTSLTKMLQKEGIKLCQDIPEQDSVIVYSSAIAKDHPFLQKARRHHLSIIHRSELLSRLVKDYTCISVAGTHGKTSTSALLSHVLLQAGQNPSFVVGGILQNYQTNAKLGSGPCFITEADESDGSFLAYPSDMAILTNLEEDHLDHWKSKQKLIEGFQQFIKRAKTLFWCQDDPQLQAICSGQISYGFSFDSDLRAEMVRTDERGSFFHVYDRGEVFEEVYIPLFGKHNVLNALAVFGLCRNLKISDVDIRKGFQSFLGVQKRLEKKQSIQAVEIYFDYAHHPSEILCTLKALKEKIQEKNMVCIFQPHRYSRVEQLMQSFQSCFTSCDRLIVTDIYAAGEQPQEGIEQILFERIDHNQKQKVDQKDLISYLCRSVKPHDVLIFIGAGDIHELGDQFCTFYAQNPNKLKVGVFYGGSSYEHEVSISSAQFFFKHFNRDLYEVEDLFLSKQGNIEEKMISKIKELDIAIPMLHGRKGEDGAIQGFLEMLDIAYVGCDYASSAICMNKGWTKLIAIRENVATAPFYEISQSSWQINRQEILKTCQDLQFYPLYVKGSHMGSSLGLTRVQDPNTIEQAIDEIFQFDDILILEQEVLGKQIEFSLWGNEQVHVGVPIEVIPRSFYSYEQKYEQVSTRLPAGISRECMEKGKELAKKIYRAANCTGLARIDFFLTDEQIYLLNEINPMPGFTPMSAYFPMVKATNILESAFIDQLIILGLQRKRKCQIKT